MPWSCAAFTKLPAAINDLPEPGPPAKNTAFNIPGSSTPSTNSTRSVLARCFLYFSNSSFLNGNFEPSLMM